MGGTFTAFGRALRSLVRPSVFFRLVWPGIVSALLWGIVAALFWTETVDVVMGYVQGFGWVGSKISALGWIASIMRFVAKLFVIFVLLLLFYVTSIVLMSWVAMPMALGYVTRRDYADLEQRHGGSDMGSIVNTVVALLWFLLVMAISLPLWLIPGVALIAPILAISWLNQRIFGYDALMRHADRDELVRLRQELRSKMMLLVGWATLLGYVPFINIVAPAFSGLAFVHFLLEALRRDRRARGTM